MVRVDLSELLIFRMAAVAMQQSRERGVTFAYAVSRHIKDIIVIEKWHREEMQLLSLRSGNKSNNSNILSGVHFRRCFPALLPGVDFQR